MIFFVIMIALWILREKQKQGGVTQPWEFIMPPGRLVIEVHWYNYSKNAFLYDITQDKTVAAAILFY